jgi:lipoyl(octanoyl) transferase
MQQNRLLKIYDCGLKEYDKVLQFQHILINHRRQGKIPNTVIIVEHTPVVTLGARQEHNKLLVPEEQLAAQHVDLVPIRRGGGATAHNPGQLVFYPILDLNELQLGISEYVRQLEQIGMELLEAFGLKTIRRKGYPGLWVDGDGRATSNELRATSDERKIASIGVRVSKHVTYHGMAINVINDLAIFESIVPCGIEGVRMTSVLRETGASPDMTAVKEKLRDILVKYWGEEGKVAYESR